MVYPCFFDPSDDSRVFKVRVYTSSYVVYAMAIAGGVFVLALCLMSYCIAKKGCRYLLGQ